MGKSIFIDRFYKKVIDKIVSQEADPINQARIKILFYGLSANLLFTAIIVLIYPFFGTFLQSVRAIISFVFALIMILAVIKWPIWKQVSHLVLVLLTLVVWSNVLIYVQSVNIATMQFILLVIVLSFYIQGLKWGLFYSLFSIAPVVLYTIFGGEKFFTMPVKAQEISRPAYVFVICYNFLLIIFLHYHFFKSFIQNIKDLKKVSNEQKILNESLKQAMDELARSSDAKMNFLSTMSHELRTPLNGVIGLTNVLLSNSPRADQKENLGILKFSAENLLALINDILDFNKLDSDKIKLEEYPTDIAELLQNVCGGISFKANEKGIDFDLFTDPALEGKLIICDPTRLTQVLLNLINNAVKFTEAGGVQVRLEVVSSAESIITIRFIIKDTGIGVPMCQQRAIFDPFTQATPSIARQFGGTGLGLAIVKHILDVHQSEIYLESEVGKGSTFFFDISFPYTFSTHEKSEAEDRNAPIQLSGLRILVAEDNQINIMVIKKLLSLWDNVPSIAENGMQAVRMVEENFFDLILMDLRMPEMDGYEAAQMIRKLENKEKASVPIIAITASVSEEVKAKVKDCGMDDYLSKPFNPQHLYNKIEELLITRVS